MSLQDNRSKGTRDKVSELLEFYDRTLLALFYHLCLDYHINETEAFGCLRDILMKQLSEKGDFPDFIELIGMYAGHKKINRQTFQHNFCSMQKHYLR